MGFGCIANLPSRKRIRIHSHTVFDPQLAAKGGGGVGLEISAMWEQAGSLGSKMQQLVEPGIGDWREGTEIRLSRAAGPLKEDINSTPWMFVKVCACQGSSI